MEDRNAKAQRARRIEKRHLGSLTDRQTESEIDGGSKRGKV